MAVIKNFRELVAYQKSRVAAKDVFLLSKRFPGEERYSLTDQIRRSSRAVASMIAEAWARRRYEAVFVNKLNEAQGEATESQAWLDGALDSQYIIPAEHARHDALFQEIGAILQGMIDRTETFCPPREARREDRSQRVEDRR
jgi:four helix bundle protein